MLRFALTYAETPICRPWESGRSPELTRGPWSHEYGGGEVQERNVSRLGGRLVPLCGRPSCPLRSTTTFERTAVQPRLDCT